MLRVDTSRCRTLFSAGGPQLFDGDVLRGRCGVNRELAVPTTSTWPRASPAGLVFTRASSMLSANSPFDTRLHHLRGPVAYPGQASSAGF